MTRNPPRCRAKFVAGKLLEEAPSTLSLLPSEHVRNNKLLTYRAVRHYSGVGTKATLRGARRARSAKGWAVAGFLERYCGKRPTHQLGCLASAPLTVVPSSDPFVEHWHRTWVRRMTWNSADYHGLTSTLTLQFVRRCYIGLEKEAQLSLKTCVMLTHASRGVCEKARLL